MSFFLAALSAALRTRLTDLRTWVLLLLLPLTAFGAVRLLPPEEAPGGYGPVGLRPGPAR